jgi:hypothetical protein
MVYTEGPVIVLDTLDQSTLYSWIQPNYWSRGCPSLLMI